MAYLVSIRANSTAHRILLAVVVLFVDLAASVASGIFVAECVGEFGSVLYVVVAFYAGSVLAIGHSVWALTRTRTPPLRHEILGGAVLSATVTLVFIIGVFALER